MLVPELELESAPELPELEQLPASVPISSAVNPCQTETAEMVSVTPGLAPNIKARCRVSSTL